MVIFQIEHQKVAQENSKLFALHLVVAEQVQNAFVASVLPNVGMGIVAAVEIEVIIYVGYQKGIKQNQVHAKIRKEIDVILEHGIDVEVHDDVDFPQIETRFFQVSIPIQVDEEVVDAYVVSIN